MPPSASSPNSPQDDLAAICRRAEVLLAARYGVPIGLEIRERFDSNHVVLRCAVHSEPPSSQLPGTLILKQRAFDRPRKPGEFDQTVLFRNEWAALDVLSSLSHETALGPRIYASDRTVGLVLLEDLGTMPSVQDVLYGTDCEAATTALVGTGATLGRLQAATHGREAEFVARQAALDVVTPPCEASLDCRSCLAELHACMAVLGIEAGYAFDRALDDLEAAIHGPSIFRALSHNDAGAHNFVVRPTGVQLLDFEFAGYGNGLIDVVCARLAFPPAFRGRIVAPQLIQQLEQGYRAALVQRIPQIGDDRLFDEAVAQSCAQWAFAKLAGFWNAYLRERLDVGEAHDTREGRAPERAAFFRMMVFTYLRLALATLDEKEQLSVLRGALARIVERLLGIWPETPLLSTFPAFGGEPWHYP